MNQLSKTCASALVASAALAGPGIAAEYADFDAVTIQRSGSFELEMSPDQALPLFTAPGEKLWIAEWDPIILNGDGFAAGTVFVTTNHGPTTYWLVSRYDVDARQAQYVRVTPGENTGTVDVVVVANADGGATVSVSYQLTGLSIEGNEELQKKYSAHNYAQMMRTWRDMIVASEATIAAHFEE